MLYERRGQSSTEPLISEDEDPSGKQKWSKKVYRAMSTGGGFRYNSLLAFSILPVALAMLALGGKVTVVTVCIGLIAAFISDLMQYDYATFGICWLSVGIIEVGLLFKGISLVKISFVHVFVLGHMALFCMMLGAWASLQFRWLKQTSGQAMTLLERVLFGCAPFCLTALETHVFVSVMGIEQIGTFILAAYAWNYYFLGLPLQSSYKESPEGSISTIQGRMEAMFSSISLITMPAIVFVCTFYRTLFEMYNFATLVGMIGTSVILLRLFNKKSALWWTGFGPHQMDSLNKVLSVVGTILITFAFEHRVILHTFYYSIPIPPPMNFAFVFIGLYTTAGICLAILMGYAHFIGKPILMSLAGVAAFALSLLLGLSVLYIPLIISSAVLFVSFYFNKDLRVYLGAVALATICLISYVSNSYMFLDYKFDVVGISLRQLSVLLIAMFIFSSLLPGIVYKSNQKFLSSVLIAVHALDIAFVESLLYVQEPSMYSWYLILATSVVGISVVNHLKETGSLEPVGIWIALSIYIGKVSLIVVPTFSSLPGSVFLCLTVASMYCLYPDNKMSIQQGVISALAVLTAAIVTRQTVAYSVLSLILDSEPSHLLLFGACFLTWGLGCLPLSFKFFPHSILVRSLTFGSISVGLLFILLEPSVGIFSGMSSFYIWTSLIACLALPFAFLGENSFLRVVACCVAGLFIGWEVTHFVFILEPTMIGSVIFPLAVALGLMNLSFFMKPTAGTASTLPAWYLGYLVLVVLGGLYFGLPAKSYARGIGSNMASTSYHIAQNSLILLAAFFNFLIALIIRMKVSTTKTRRVTSNLEWMPLIGNLATLITYICFVYSSIGSRSPMISLLISPILLLINQDAYFLKELPEVSRFPPVLAVASLTMYVQAVSYYWPALRFAIYPLQFKNLGSIALNLLLLHCAVPAHAMFVNFLWKYEKQNTMLWLIVAPLCLLTLFTSNVSGMLFGAVGLVEGLVQFYLSRNAKRYDQL